MDQENPQNEPEVIPKRRIGPVLRLFIMVMVLALIVGSIGGYGTVLIEYFQSSRVGRQDLISRGDQAFAEENFEAAIDYYERAILLSPGHPDNAALHSGIGTAYYYQDEIDKALVSFHRSLEIDPDFWPSLYSAGIIYHFERQDYQRAYEQWDRLLEMEWEDDEVRKHIEELHEEAEEKLEVVG